MEHNHDFHSVLQKLGRPVVYYPRVCDAFGDDLRCAIFLSNFSYWEGKQHDQDGWIYKSQADIKKETGLGRYMQEQSRKKLRELGILHEKLIGKPPVLHYRFDWSKMNEVLNNHFSGKEKEKVQQKEDPLLFRMKETFDAFYEIHSEGNQFEWGSDKKNSGKHWAGLKNLSEAFSKRIEAKKKKDSLPPDVTDDEIVNSFSHFLSLMPEYIVNKFLAPNLIYSKFSEILVEMIKKQNANKSSQNQPSTPTDYV